MIVVGDQSTAGKAIERQVDKMLAGVRNDFTVEFWFELTLEETLQRANKLTGDAFFFFTPWYQTIKGKFYTTEEVMEAISSTLDIPIYTTWEFLLGHGAVGGSMLSGVSHGREAARMALRVLDGESVATIPIVYQASGQYMFDYIAMQKLGIDMKKLPEDSVIVNSPKGFYELSKELFWTIMVSLVLLVTALIFLGINMVARRRIETRALDQLAFQETLMDSIPQLVSWKDRQGRYLGANSAFLDFFRIAELNQMVGNTTKDMVADPEYANWSVKADAEVVERSEAIRRVRKKIQTTDGRTGWIEVNKVPLRDQNGTIVGVLSTAENVTKERELERQLLQSQKMEAIGTLAGGIAHDFNNILTSIINSTELAIGDVEPDSATAKDLQRVIRAARRGSRVVKQILSFSRPSPDVFRQVDIRKVIQEVLMLMDVSLPSSITVITDYDDREYLIDADPTQIHQAMLNLCTNAFQALRESGGLLVIRLEERNILGEAASELQLAPGNYILVRVKDNGVGISPEVIDKIFDPFFTTKDLTEGTGLGLSVVHGIVNGHRGAVRVTSNEGRGAEFVLYLPSSPGTVQASAPPPSASVPERLSILFVEDDPDQLNSTPRILELMGHTVLALADPIAAFEAVRKEPLRFDVVITDYDMVEINGVELAESIAPLPVILVSGREEAALAASRVANILHVIAKPYDKNDLIRVLAGLKA